MKRVDAGDGEAIRRVGSYYFEGKGTAAGQSVERLHIMLVSSI